MLELVNYKINGMSGSMLKLILRRIFSSLLILFLLITFIFILLRIAPGDPTLKYISPELSSELADKVKESFHLNGTITEQYIVFIKNSLTGNFGISYNYRSPVFSVISEYFIFTLIFSLICFSIQIILSYYLSIKAFKNRGKLLDKSLSALSLIVYSIPSFVSAIIFIYIFSIWFNLLPSSDLRSFNFENLSWFEKIIDYFRHLLLPIITLSLGGTVIFYKYIRENFDSINTKSFIQYSRTLGFSDNEILAKHIIPNSIGPLISVAGIELGLLLGGALITEVIFGLPGMGRLTVNAILLRDYPLVLGCTFVSGALVILANLLADLTKVIIDKRLTKEILN